MKISTKGRYALRMLLELAQHPENECVSLKEISEHQGISKKYLEQIVPMLNKSGLLRTSRGNKGGYMLAKQPHACTVGDVLRATEGSLAPVACLEYDVNECPRAGYCETLFVWKGLSDAISGYLDSVTLQDILDRAAGSGGDDYSI